MWVGHWTEISFGQFGLRRYGGHEPWPGRSTDESGWGGGEHEPRSGSGRGEGEGMSPRIRCIHIYIYYIYTTYNVCFKIKNRVLEISCRWQIAINIKHDFDNLEFSVVLEIICHCVNTENNGFCLGKSSQSQHRMWTILIPHVLPMS